MDVSVVVVNWNTKALLLECLASIYDSGQTCSFEVIVIDNHSQDGSAAAAILAHPSIILIQNSDNRGFAVANNQGFEVARGEYILMLNSDTLVHGNVIADCRHYMEQHAGIGILGCHVLNTDGTTQLNSSRFPNILNLGIMTLGIAKIQSLRWADRYQLSYWDRKQAADIDVISGCFMLIRKKAMQEVGTLDEAFFFFGEETDWCKRMKIAGWRVHYAPIEAITHHGGGSVKSLNHKRDIMLSQATIRFNRKHYGFFAGFCVWILLIVFNLSRLIYWTGLSFIRPNIEIKDRRNHFFHIIKNFSMAWPNDKGAW